MLILTLLANWGFDILCLPHCGEFDIRVCQIPTIAHISRGGEYIDKCIRTKYTESCGFNVNQWLNHVSLAWPDPIPRRGVIASLLWILRSLSLLKQFHSISLELPQSENSLVNQTLFLRRALIDWRL